MHSKSMFKGFKLYVYNYGFESGSAILYNKSDLRCTEWIIQEIEHVELILNKS